jgi:hypothetical protein
MFGVLSILGELIKILEGNQNEPEKYIKQPDLNEKWVQKKDGKFVYVEPKGKKK